MNTERMTAIANAAAELGECDFSVQDVEQVIERHCKDFESAEAAEQFLSSAPISEVGEWALQMAFIG